MQAEGALTTCLVSPPKRPPPSSSCSPTAAANLDSSPSSLTAALACGGGVQAPAHGGGALGCGGGARTPACGRWSTCANAAPKLGALACTARCASCSRHGSPPSRTAGSPGAWWMRSPWSPTELAHACGDGRTRPHARLERGQARPVVEFACERWPATFLHAGGLLYPPMTHPLSPLSSLPSPAAEIDPIN